ncbi:MAG: polysaccharide biosynthesis/export family protein [Pirellulaceae bacterium]|nr:polysaccharide biosynthesis/export family protein [Pirellulaceae bacterium]
MMKLANFLRKKLLAVMLLGVGAASGCTTLTQPISGIPADRLPPQFFNEEKNSLVPIDLSILGQERPRQYVLDKGDVLGIYVDRVLPFTEPDAVPVMPPVNVPSEKSTLPPSTGFPFTVLEDGTISLPLLRPLKVKGLTLDQTRDLIRKSYVEAKILKEDGNQFVSPVVTMIRERVYNVVVIRQDMGSTGGVQGGRAGVQGADESARGNVVKLPAYQNDVLHALMETGGLPGLTAKNEVKILRASKADQMARAAFMRQYAEMVACHNDPCSCPPPMPDDPTAKRIPMRLPVGVLPSIAPEDVLLEDGDIVLVESRENEFFYTGGLLPGGQWALPRDYDLDALGAMALAGGGIASGGRGGGGGVLGGAQGFGGVPPGRLYILRRTPCKGQIAIEVDLARATNNPAARPIIQPGDTLILQYRPIEEALNFGLGSFFTFGIQQILQQRN